MIALTLMSGVPQSRMLGFQPLSRQHVDVLASAPVKLLMRSISFTDAESGAITCPHRGCRAWIVLRCGGGPLLHAVSGVAGCRPAGGGGGGPAGDSRPRRGAPDRRRSHAG